MPSAEAGRVAQRESTPFTRVGSQVQSLSRPPLRKTNYDRRVAQWQSAPITWERSGVRFLFAPTTASAYPSVERTCGGEDAVDAYRRF